MVRYIQEDSGNFVRHIPNMEPVQWDEDTLCRVSALTPEQKDRFGVRPLKLVTPPPYDFTTQTLVDGPALLLGGVWTQNWIVETKTPEEIGSLAETQWSNIRAERHAKLIASDWTQLPDAPVDAAAWASYRQELRDITSQPDPFNIVWPAAPGA